MSLYVAYCKVPASVGLVSYNSLQLALDGFRPTTQTMQTRLIGNTTNARSNTLEFLAYAGNIFMALSALAIDNNPRPPLVIVQYFPMLYRLGEASVRFKWS